MNIAKHTKSKRLKISEVSITDQFWNQRLEMNRESAIFYQWKQLEKQHNQDNFRVVAGLKEGYRFGFFYCDSDLHKWADAAARILITSKNEPLKKLMREYVDLMEVAQQKDGYLFTYNQFHFPDKRWISIQIEHELYCLGHLIEAGISYIEAQESIRYRVKLLGIVTKAADLLVETFEYVKSKYTPGHQEIEIALIKLYRFTGEKKYLDLATQFIEQRGQDIFFGIRLIRQAVSQGKRTKTIEKDMESKKIAASDQVKFFGGETKQQKEAPLLKLRSTFQFLSGRYHQQNRPVTKMRRPFGHSVRWGYLATAIAMLYQENGDPKLLKALERTWNHLVQKQMFITGGIGALGAVEGFGRDYELHGDYCYCETCAAIANILLNWELALITNEAKYSNLLEWQLYNAMSVGIALDGKSYLYRNLLESDGQLSRKEWFATPCCPSNISRVWATIGEYIYSYNEKNIWIHQYIGNTTKLQLEDEQKQIDLKMDSKFPWEGKVSIEVNPLHSQEFTLNLRIPSWCKKPKIIINEKEININTRIRKKILTGSGFTTENSFFYPLTQKWDKGSKIELILPMEITIHKAHPKVKSNKNRIALSRGPLVYCFESNDNPTLSFDQTMINLKESPQLEIDEDLFGGINKILTKDNQGKTLIAIPYFCWANRGTSKLITWIKIE